MERLRYEIKHCNRCRLCETRTNALCGEGPLNARLMLVAQAPGEKEDMEGRMFIGPSGKVLDKLLQEAGIDRERLYMTNLIKCMLPRYRRPKQDEISACSPYLERETELVNPEILVPLGFYATRYILQKYEVPMPARDEFCRLYGETIKTSGPKILPLQHPAAALHTPQLLKEMTENYRKMKTLLMDFP